MKKESRKLNLVRETIAPLQGTQLQTNQLADVNGGAQSVSISVSKGRSYGISFSGWSVGVSYGESASAGISY
jgi:hypothetical protein